MKIKSTELVLAMARLQKMTPRWEIVKLRMSRDAKKLFHTLSFQGFFSDFLMSKEYKSGLVHLVKVR